MFQVLLENKILLFGGIGILIFFATYLTVRIVNGQKKKKELRMIAEDRLREDTLDEIIQNSQAGNRGIKNLSIPYEVDYSNSKQNIVRPVSEGGTHISLQLIEHNELSVRKHMINLEKTVCIGSMPGKSTLVVSGAEPSQCEIFEYNGSAYVRNTAVNRPTKIKRKKKTAYVDKNGTKLQSGDFIIIERMYFEVGIL